MKLPKKVDLTEGLELTIYDQGELGADVACAIASTIEILEKKYKPKNLLYAHLKKASD